MSEPLKPCPFCGTAPPKPGDEPRRFAEGLGVGMKDHSYYVYCSVCGTEGPLCRTEEAARKRWAIRLSEAQ